MYTCTILIAHCVCNESLLTLRSQDPLGLHNTYREAKSQTQTYHKLRHHRHPSWTCACGNGASCRPSSRCAWPTAWPPSSCRPSWRMPSCGTNVSWAPWFQRLETTNSGQLRTTQSGGTNTIQMNRKPTENVARTTTTCTQ